MGSSGSIPRDKHIVIVGAGYGGVQIALELLKEHVDFTIIDTHPYHYHNLASVRGTSQQGLVEKLFIPLDQTFGSHFKQGKVLDVNPSDNTVTLEDGATVKYDLLVLATGSFGDVPFKPKDDVTIEEIVKVCHDTVDKLKSVSVKKVVVIGGGAVGVEVAAEIATDYKDKEVTIVHSSDTLIATASFITDKFQKNLKDKLTKKGIKLVLGESISNLPTEGVSGPCELRTTKGTVLQADLVYKCIGMKVDSTAYQKTLSSSMESNGQLKVNQHLQVEGFENIFACGDCTNTKEFKTAFRAMEQAKILVPNIKLFLNKRKLKTYDPAKPMFGIGLSVGRKEGLGVTAGGTILPQFLIVQAKSKDLMLSTHYKEMHQKVPS